MFHHKILEKFKEIFPGWASDIYQWKPAGKNIIEIKITSRKDELIFEYHSPKRWCLRSKGFLLEVATK